MRYEEYDPNRYKLQVSFDKNATEKTENLVWLAEAWVKISQQAKEIFESQLAPGILPKVKAQKMEEFDKLLEDPEFKKSSTNQWKKGMNEETLAKGLSTRISYALEKNKKM